MGLYNGVSPSIFLLDTNFWENLICFTMLRDALGCFQTALLDIFPSHNRVPHLASCLLPLAAYSLSLLPLAAYSLSLLPLASCLLPLAAYSLSLLPLASCLLPPIALALVSCLLACGLWLLAYGSGLLPLVSCILPLAFCLLPLSPFPLICCLLFAICLLPLASCLFHFSCILYMSRMQPKRNRARKS
jgi:hypothetical protein